MLETSVPGLTVAATAEVPSGLHGNRFILEIWGSLLFLKHLGFFIWFLDHTYCAQGITLRRAQGII